MSCKNTKVLSFISIAILLCASSNVTYSSVCSPGQVLSPQQAKCVNIACATGSGQHFDFITGKCVVNTYDGAYANHPKLKTFAMRKNIILQTERCIHYCGKFHKAQCGGSGCRCTWSSRKNICTTMDVDVVKQIRT